MKKSLLILIIVLLFGCHPHYEVYKHYPKDTVLTYDMFTRSRKIFLTDSFLILQFNIQKKEDLWWNPFATDYFLFFFNDSLKLKYACYAQGFIDSFVNKTFYISVDSIEQKSWKYEICDLPRGYKIEQKRWRYKSYKSVGIDCYYTDSLDIINNDSLLIYGLTTDTPLVCWRWCSNFDTLKNPRSVFRKIDTIAVNIQDLTFDYECREAHIYRVIDSCKNRSILKFKFDTISSCESRLIIKLDTNKYKLLYKKLVNYMKNK